MRVRTEAKRAAIIDVAARLFREQGYERTSMALISAEVGGSKATLYGYFASKEQLFVAVIRTQADQEIEPSIERLEHGIEPLEERLQRFGDGLLAFLTKVETIGGRRMVIAEAGRSGIGRMLYEWGPRELERRLAAVFTREMTAGRIKRVDARVASLQFLALLEAETLMPNLMALGRPLTKRELTRAVQRAVTTFMDAHRTPPA